jgi:hypothetical protein
VDVHIHVFLTSALVGNEWSASRSCRFTPGERAPRYPLGRRLGVSQSRSGRYGEVRILVSTGTRTPIPRPVSSRCLDSYLSTGEDGIRFPEGVADSVVTNIHRSILSSVANCTEVEAEQHVLFSFKLVHVPTGTCVGSRLVSPTGN